MENKNLFRQYRLLSLICLLFSHYGFYVQLHWSNNKLYPSSEIFGLGYTNSFKEYRYRLKIVYLNKKERKLTNANILRLYSNDIKFILTPKQV